MFCIRFIEEGEGNTVRKKERQFPVSLHNNRIKKGSIKKKAVPKKQVTSRKIK